jgi:TonB family protein
MLCSLTSPASTPFASAFLILVTLLMAGCRSAPSSHSTNAADPKTAAKKGPIKITQFFATPENCGLVHYVRPLYPKEAKRAHIQGEVKLSFVITKTGDVGELHLVSGNPVLVPAAVAAVRQWRYAPCRLNGEPVEIKSVVVVPFNLNY